MKVNKLGATLAMAAMLLSACGSDITHSGFRSVDEASEDGVVNVSLLNRVDGNIFDANYGGVAYVIGVDLEQYEAWAGVMPNSTVGAEMDNGSATYTGQYSLAKVSGVDLVNDTPTGNAGADFGNITLTADFDRQTIIGSDGDLEIDGRIDGTALSGDVEYEGIDGELQGVIGADAAIGAFHGHDSDTVYAGGFVAERD